MKTTEIISKPTLDQCVEALVKLGCKWDAEKEAELVKKSAFKYKSVLVFYDPFNLLAL